MDGFGATADGGFGPSAFGTADGFGADDDGGFESSTFESSAFGEADLWAGLRVSLLSCDLQEVLVLLIAAAPAGTAGAALAPLAQDS